MCNVCIKSNVKNLNLFISKLILYYIVMGNYKIKITSKYNEKPKLFRIHFRIKIIKNLD